MSISIIKKYNDLSPSGNAFNFVEASGLQGVHKTGLVSSLDAMNDSVKNDMTKMRDAMENSENFHIRDYLNVLKHAQTMSLKYDLYAKLAAKGISGMEGLLKTS